MRIFLLFLVIICILCAAQKSDAAQTVTIIVTENATYDAYRLVKTPEAASFRRRAAVGLLSTSMARKPSPRGNLFAELGAGDTANIKNPNKDLLQRTVAKFPNAGSLRIITAPDMRWAFLLADTSSLPGSGDTAIICGILPIDPKTGEWDRLSVAAIAGPVWQHGLLMSDTTDTIGLIALRDIAPTTLHILRIDPPDSMTGAFALIACAPPGRFLPEMDRISHLNQQILIPAMWCYGLAGGITLLATLAFLSKKENAALEPLKRKLAQGALKVVQSIPMAFLLASAFSPRGVVEYGIDIAALAIGLGALLPLGALYALVALTILYDAVMGGHLIARSVFSSYWISGIRFYGIGAEYMGVLLGAGMLAPYLVAGERRVKGCLTSELGAALLALWQILIVVVLVSPQFGAKAGGAITATAAFAPTWLWLVLRRKPNVKIFVISVIIGFIVVFAITSTATEMGARPTHIQSAVSHAEHGQWVKTAQMALRKIKLEVATAITPGSIAAYLCMIPAWFIWKKTALRSVIEHQLSRMPIFAGMLKCMASACAASLLFNDSGFVSFVLILAAFTTVLLYNALEQPQAA